MKKPNIVFILSDDQGYYSLGKMKMSDLKTPNLDQLIDRGVWFQNFFCVSPVCSPARASILTGNIPSNHGVLDWVRAGNIDPEALGITREERRANDYEIEHQAIPYLRGQMTYTDLLQANGYTCALSGKWHLGDSINPQHGFSKWYTIGKGGCAYMNPDVIEEGRIKFENQYLTELISNKAVEYIDELTSEENPFYLSVHYTAPHSPWGEEHHPKKYKDLYSVSEFENYPNEPMHVNSKFPIDLYLDQEKRREFLIGYEASITAMDEGIGQIMKKLEEKGILEETIIIFTSDNGMNMGHHGIWGKGNGTKPKNMYDTSVKVPFIISCPEKILEGKIIDGIFSHYDIFPTLLELAGINYEAELPGQSLVDVLTGKQERRTGEVVVYDEYGDTRMIRSERYKYIHRYPSGPNEFYNLEKDPGECNNLYEDKKYHEEIHKMRNKMTGWFNKYTNINKDATKENVTGLGQLCSVGEQAELFEVFYPDRA